VTTITKNKKCFNLLSLYSLWSDMRSPRATITIIHCWAQGWTNHKQYF